MITYVKKIKNGYKVEEFIFSERKIKKYKLEHNELVTKLNSIKFNDELKADLLLEKYAYKHKKDEDMFNNGILTGTFLISALIILFCLCPILILPLLVFSLYGIKYLIIKNDKFSCEKDIYDKLILYYENIDVCKCVKANTFDGSILSLYFNSEKEIKRVIENEKIKKDNIYNEKYQFTGNEKNKTLVHKRSVK